MATSCADLIQQVPAHYGTHMETWFSGERRNRGQPKLSSRHQRAGPPCHRLPEAVCDIVRSAQSPDRYETRLYPNQASPGVRRRRRLLCPSPGPSLPSRPEPHPATLRILPKTCD